MDPPFMWNTTYIFGLSQNAFQISVNVNNQCSSLLFLGIFRWNQVPTWPRASLCCSHTLPTVDQSTPSLPFFMLTPTAWNVSKFSWFPSLLSWRRNFLGKHLTFLATGELPVQPEPGCLSALHAQLLTNNRLSLEGGQHWSRWLPNLLKRFADLAYTVRACAEC